MFLVFFFGDGEIVLRLLANKARAEIHLAVAHLHLLYLGKVLLLGLLDEAAHHSAIGEIRLALEVLQRRRDVEFLDDPL